jgi:Protein of unknown function (DUF3037)
VSQPYEWAVLRVVPRVERSEFVNAGIVLYSQQLDFLGAQVALADDRARGLDPEVDLDLVRSHLDAIVALCAGADSADPNANRPAGERFRWLVAPRSTVVQPSRVHVGLTDDPAAELRRLVASVVSMPGRGSHRDGP